FLAITTYAMAAKMEALQEISWDVLVLDEAQAIKNPGTKQTKSIKKLKTRCRIAMTGTPIENDLSNLWSLFDFLNKGLLGSSTQFRKYANQLVEHPESYHKLRQMVAPFVLRRLKTDKSIIHDLPEKMEQVDYAALSKKQVVLYRKLVKEVEQKLAISDGMSRRGVILAAITKLKQICNHPDQFLGQSAYSMADSGKFELLRDICETIYEKRERVLVFTQYREITESLAEFLTGIFHRKGLVLHGGTRVKKRMELVEQFNGEEYCPFMVLSVKAAGTGLNLTAANHVIHFDRWWNPAVENQATDRAYRIGQEKDVMVHKLVSRGTIEERIDEIIEGKKKLAESVIGAGEQWVTELSDKEVLELMRLEV
ncbi:MAG: DEAD/DEAH box helicase, partial [Selenomonadaceae bacterium]|nr:DEAD/DEAH box helicase [Selenomonadaceae bacterium]